MPPQTVYRHRLREQDGLDLMHFKGRFYRPVEPDDLITNGNEQVLVVANCKLYLELT